MQIADVKTGIEMGPRSYQVHLAYHTTGLVNLFSRGVNDTTVTGVWQGNMAQPTDWHAQGSWRGDPRLADIAFVAGMPVVRQLDPADAQERGPVPNSLKAGSIDTLSAMIDLLREATLARRCDLSDRTFDGHRIIQFVSRTVGPETLGPYRGSWFTGSTLRCDFTGTPIAGMKTGDSADARPFRGSIWIASPVAGAPPIPVRMAFQTRWFGDAVMYLMQAQAAPGLLVAGAH
ncbi:hypothetical protein [Rhodopila sp.]|uniref:DUF3108 domain-containing protein n=1 Tax=Rhodopila sp. TaxID=2480087 RepID=UPI0038D16AD2